MNAVEIEEAVSQLADQPFDAATFPFEFLRAFGNKDVTLNRLRTGNNNASDVPGGVLQRNNIHLAVCAEGAVGETLNALRMSPRTAANKARFILATDGIDFQAEDLTLGETVACDFAKFPDHFGFFLALAGISTVKQIRESAFDIRATGRLNKLYVQLLQDNPDWGAAERRPDMNHFMARLIFCFFAEDTGIFFNEGVFTRTVEQMSERDASNTHTVIEAIFRAMNTPVKHDGRPDDRYRKAANTPRWADVFPYVNGGLFSGSADVPRFSRIARSYFLHIGGLDWKKINPDIFGSMIQAVADDGERSELGMHYTSVPNILKVLNPLFLDDLREQLEAAGDNGRSLLNLRKRMARIRVFDPACGSGNFLVIAYKQMREIEAEINRRRGEAHLRSEIPLTNFRGIEIRDFAAEIARLALIIAEYQADVLYLGQKEALAEFLPLDSQNWITCGNALRLDWLSVCPPSGAGVKLHGDDLFNTPLDQAQIDFENEGGETYICGNPPYKGDKVQTDEQKSDLAAAFAGSGVQWRSLDYITGWFFKAAKFNSSCNSRSALVSTNSVCQGQQVPLLWPYIFEFGQEIIFAHTSFTWSNLASHNAGVTVVIVALGSNDIKHRKIFTPSKLDFSIKNTEYINAYLVPGGSIIVDKSAIPLAGKPPMDLGNMPKDGGNLLMSRSDVEDLQLTSAQKNLFVRPLVGSREFINGIEKYCLWIEDNFLPEAKEIDSVRQRIEATRRMRLESDKAQTRKFAAVAHRFVEVRFDPAAENPSHAPTIIVPRITSGNREYLPAGICPPSFIPSSQNFAIFRAELWPLSLIISQLHLTWVGAVCGRTRTDFAYSNSLGWNTFPVPTLTDQNKSDLTRCAEDILLAREAHWPATIADLYDPDAMPADLRAAHDRNDETLERIYIGRRFRNDTERLEKLFELYTDMTASGVAGAKVRKSKLH